MAKGTFGERLKRERELREVSAKEVTAGTRISGRYLEALENEDWDRLPGGAFNRGFVRAIARYLGLNEENLLAEYDLARGDHGTPAPQPYENKIPRPPIWVPIAALLGILALLAGLVAGGIYTYRWIAKRRAMKKTAALLTVPAPTTVNGESATVSAASDSQANLPLRLSVSTSAATRIRVVGDNVVLLDAEVPAGETRPFSATRQFEISAANSSAVLLELNGQAMPPIGMPGASGTIVLSQKDLRPTSGGTAQPRSN